MGPGIRPQPFIAIWARGAAKSTSAELAAALIGMTQRRAYIIYVSGTQDQADTHVQSIGSLLERAGIERAVNKYGTSRGWRRDRLRSETFTIDALGLDTGARGIRIDEDRPGLIILDDVDDLHDTEETVAKKIATLTNTILPSGSTDCATLFVQNLIHKNSIASRLVDGRADFLLDRSVSGPYPALKRFEYEAIEGIIKITAGEPTWEGLGIAECENIILTSGIHAFQRECQHDVHQAENGLWRRADIDGYRVMQHPPLDRIVIGVDPPGSKKTECGIVADGGARIYDKIHVYTLEDASMKGAPNEWGNAVVAAYHKWKANAIIAEKNFGGDMIEAVIKQVDSSVHVELRSASRGKDPRAEPVADICAEGREHHVGKFEKLEDEQCTWVVGMPSPNRMDAHVWAARELIGSGPSMAEIGNQGDTSSRWNVFGATKPDEKVRDSGNERSPWSVM